MGVMSVSNLAVDGEILSETRGGVGADYIPDPLGSTAALTNSSQTITDTFSWWPFGGARNHSGSSQTPFGFAGTLGYNTDSSDQIYVINNTPRPSFTRWQTTDKLWPSVRAYVYARNDPINAIDVLGLNAVQGSAPQPSQPFGYGEPWNGYIYAYCNNCYYGTGAAPNCKAKCNAMANQYYFICGKVGLFPSNFPIVGWQPACPGCSIVPVRGLPGWWPGQPSPGSQPTSSTCNNIGVPSDPRPATPDPNPCVQVGMVNNGAGTDAFDVSACRTCCKQYSDELACDNCATRMVP